MIDIGEWLLYRNIWNHLTDEEIYLKDVFRNSIYI